MVTPTRDTPFPGARAGRTPTLVPVAEPDDDSLPAGPFSPWLGDMRVALKRGLDMDVACGTCTACCTSSQFVHIEPDETDTLAHVPKELLAPAPLLPKGHLVIGYDERGHCPMLVDNKCSIYEHRPRTCRTYDCRVFEAAGVAVDDEDSPAIAERARRWRFDLPSAEDAADIDAVRSAAAFLKQDAGGDMDSTAAAVLALEVYDLFLDGAQPDAVDVHARLEQRF
jgi:Fe-S-cluster containining protein